MAACMTVDEWATSGAGVCQSLNRLNLGHMEMEIGRSGYQEQQQIPAEDKLVQVLGAMRWASKRWQACTHLHIRLDTSVQIPGEDAADLASLLKECSPQHLKTLGLLALHNNLAAGCIFEALLASLKLDGPLECLKLGDETEVPSLPALRNVTLFHMDDVRAEKDIGHFVAPLSCLEVLDLSATFECLAVLNLGHMRRLQRLVLTRISLTELELPPQCKIYVRGCTDNSANAAVLWLACPGRELVDILYLRFSSYERLGLYHSDSFGYLREFPNLEVLDIHFHFEDLQKPTEVLYDFKLHAWPPLRFLSCLRLVSEARQVQKLEVHLPASLALRSLIIAAGEIILKVESPGRMSSTLQELILASVVSSIPATVCSLHWEVTSSSWLSVSSSMGSL